MGGLFGLSYAWEYMMGISGLWTATDAAIGLVTHAGQEEQ